VLLGITYTTPTAQPGATDNLQRHACSRAHRGERRRHPVDEDRLGELECAERERVDPELEIAKVREINVRLECVSATEECLAGLTRSREKPRLSRAFLGRERRDSNPRPLP